jgi:hypothetical protein
LNGSKREGEKGYRIPIRGIFPACCASADSGAARRPRARVTISGAVLGLTFLLFLTLTGRP